MITTLVVQVENKPGVLNRVASLFRRRAFNIESLTVGHTHKPGISRMTIVVDTDESGAARLEANLYKLVNVLRVENISHTPTVRRDLAVIKPTALSTTLTRSKSIFSSSNFPASSFETSSTSFTILRSASPDS